MSKGVLYMVWGDKIEQVLQRSIASVKEFHPELPHEVVRLPSDTDGHKGLLEKPRMMDLTPFDETLFLDADTVVLDRLDFGFAQASRFGLACSICECPWARRYRGLPKDDAIEYNTGVLFFNRSADAVFKRWQELASTVDSSTVFVMADGRVATMNYNDQCSFAKAVAEWTRPPFVLPQNWNFRPGFHLSFFGPIKIWHDYGDPPASFKQLNAYYRKPDSIIQFHTPSGST
jgi:hypothetical protein